MGISGRTGAPSSKGLGWGQGGGQHRFLGVGRGTPTLQLLCPVRTLVALGEAHAPGRTKLQTPWMLGL